MSERPALSREIAADLRDSILSGELSPGAVLPSEREMIARYKTTKSTASKAIALLRAEGLVTTEFGRGTFVRNRPPLRRISAARRHAAHRSSGKPIFDIQAIDHGQIPSRQILQVGRALAPADAAKWLQGPTGHEVVIRKRLQLLDNEPAVISTSYYPLWVAGGTRLEQPAALPEGPDELIEALGHSFVHGIEVFHARMPTIEEAKLLRLGPGIPVVRMWDVDYDAEGRTLQVSDDVYAGDRHEFAYEWNEGDIRS
ncbi:MAG: GntR family transcriptional regulator [Gemmatimonadales bacterium]|nr:GntR family transcriptional regulator [Gemmatimonadales bacterium]